MNKPSRKATTILATVATPVAMLAAAAMIWQSSNAAFSGTTRNSGNNWSTGSVALTDDDAGAARFQSANMVPGATEIKCIAVTATATVPGVVKGYTLNPVISPSGLQNHIMVSMRYGTGGGFGSCTGFVAGAQGDSEGILFPATSLAALATKNSYADSVGSWAVSPGTQTRTYEITWSFVPPSGGTALQNQTALDALQGAQTGIDIQWELQSN